MKRLWFAFAALMALCFSCQAFPQPFPNKPVRMLIGPGAGGPTDGMVRQRLEQQGIDPGSSATREDFAAFVKSETVKWAKVVRDANIPTQ